MVEPAELLKVDTEKLNEMYILINKIWEEQYIPLEWTKKNSDQKGNLRKCKNWRPITVQYTASKIM